MSREKRRESEKKINIISTASEGPKRIPSWNSSRESKIRAHSNYTRRKVIARKRGDERIT
jgi:hypothetical protein